MASSGNKISYPNFDAGLISYSRRFYAENDYTYVFAESWGVTVESRSAFLNDWHGTIYIDKWIGNGWSNVWSHYLQDTSSNKKISFCNNFKYPDYELPASASHREGMSANLWRIRSLREKWGGNYGADRIVYIGSCNTMAENTYNSRLKYNKIYSNGTIGKNLCGVLEGGNSPLSDSFVLSYFASNKGTKAYGSYSRYFIGALRT